MTVVEFAILHVNPGIIPTHPSLLTNLAACKRVMEGFTQRPFYYLRQREDPSVIYALGEWPSVEFHNTSFVGSPAYRELVTLLAPFVGIELLVHVDVDARTLPLDAPVISIGRHSVPPTRLAAFQKAFGENKQHLDGYVSRDRKPTGGWRVERGDDGCEEWILFCGWETIEEHFGFASTEAFANYSRIREFIANADIKHAEVIPLSGS